MPRHADGDKQSTHREHHFQQQPQHRNNKKNLLNINKQQQTTTTTTATTHKTQQQTQQTQQKQRETQKRTAARAARDSHEHQSRVSSNLSDDDNCGDEEEEQAQQVEEEYVVVSPDSFPVSLVSSSSSSPLERPLSPSHSHNTKKHKQRITIDARKRLPLVPLAVNSQTDRHAKETRTFDAALYSTPLVSTPSRCVEYSGLFCLRSCHFYTFLAFNPLDTTYQLTSYSPDANSTLTRTTAVYDNSSFLFPSVFNLSLVRISSVSYLYLVDALHQQRLMVELGKLTAWSQDREDKMHKKVEQQRKQKENKQKKEEKAAAEAEAVKAKQQSKQMYGSSSEEDEDDDRDSSHDSRGRDDDDDDNHYAHSNKRQKQNTTKRKLSYSSMSRPKLQSSQQRERNTEAEQEQQFGRLFVVTRLTEHHCYYLIDPSSNCYLSAKRDDRVTVRVKKPKQQEKWMCVSAQMMGINSIEQAKNMMQERSKRDQQLYKAQRGSLSSTPPTVSSPSLPVQQQQQAPILLNAAQRTLDECQEAARLRVAVAEEECADGELSSHLTAVYFSSCSSLPAFPPIERFSATAIANKLKELPFAWRAERPLVYDVNKYGQVNDTEAADHATSTSDNADSPLLVKQIEERARNNAQRWGEQTPANTTVAVHTQPTQLNQPAKSKPPLLKPRQPVGEQKIAPTDKKEEEKKATGHSTTTAPVTPSTQSCSVSLSVFPSETVVSGSVSSAALSIQPAGAALLKRRIRLKKLSTRSDDEQDSPRAQAEAAESSYVHKQDEEEQLDGAASMNAEDNKKQTGHQQRGATDHALAVRSIAATRFADDHLVFPPHIFEFFELEPQVLKRLENYSKEQAQ